MLAKFSLTSVIASPGLSAADGAHRQLYRLRIAPKVTGPAGPAALMGAPALITSLLSVKGKRLGDVFADTSSSFRSGYGLPAGRRS